MALPYYTRLEVDHLLQELQSTTVEPTEGGSVLYFDEYEDFPLVGEVGNLYVDNSDGIIYTWNAELGDYKEEGRTQIQSDWNEPSTSSAAYIRNRPNVNKGFRPFTTKWNVSAGQVINLPLSTAANYDFQVDWGDGTAPQQINSGDSEFKSHTYTEAGIYQVSIKGVLDSFEFSADNTEPIIEIVQWGDIQWKRLTFKNCSQLSVLPTIDYPNLTQVSSLEWLFGNCAITTIPFDIFTLATGVTDFAFIFRGNAITEIPAGLFNNCLSGIRFDSAFKVNKITTIPSGLFRDSINAKSFKDLFRDNLISVLPEDTFSSCVLMENGSHMFFENDIQEIPKNFFRYNRRINDLSECFRYNNFTVAVPEIWLDFPDIPSINCFGASSTLPPNYDEIPETWGGGFTGTYPEEIEELKAYWHKTLLKPIWKRSDGVFVDATGTIV